MSFISYTPAKALLDAARGVLDESNGVRLLEAIATLHDAVAAADAAIAQAASVPGVIESARNTYASGSDDDIEIDDHPMVATAENGTWVQAWVWVEAEDEEDAHDPQTT